MTKIETFLSSLAKLAEIPHADRIDRQNHLVFKDELAGSSVFAKDDRERAYVLFRGFPVTAKTIYLRELGRFLELTHYLEAHTLTDEEIKEHKKLQKSLTASEPQFPEIASVMSVETVAQVASNWL